MLALTKNKKLVLYAYKLYNLNKFYRKNKKEYEKSLDSHLPKFKSRDTHHESLKLSVLTYVKSSFIIHSMIKEVNVFFKVSSGNFYFNERGFKMNYNVIPNYLVKELNNRDFRVLTYLNSKAYGKKCTCYPFINTVAKELNMCKRTVQYAISSLCDKGIIRREYRHYFNKITGKVCQSSNLFTLLYKSVMLLAAASKNKNFTIIEKEIEKDVKKNKTIYNYTYNKSNSTAKKENKFITGCCSRDYSKEQYDDIEKRLLGWV